MPTHPHIYCGVEVGAEVSCSCKIYVLLHGTYLMVWVVRILCFTTWGTGSISGRRAKISPKTYVLLYVHRIFLKDTQEPFNIFSFVEVDQLFIA